MLIEDLEDTNKQRQKIRFPELDATTRPEQEIVSSEKARIRSFLKLMIAGHKPV